MTATATCIINPETLHTWIASGKAFHLFHTLPGDHYARARIPGAANACVYEVTFMEQVYAVTRDKSAPVVVYGDNADTMAATVAAEKLLREDFVNVYVLTGGLERWQAMGFELVGSDTQPPADSGHPAPLETGTYILDPDTSIIEWTGRNPNTKHHGTLSLSEGRLSVDGADVSGKFKIDMNTIHNLNLAGDELQPVLEAHLKSDDFFFVKLFPWAWFHLKATRQVEDPTYTLPNYEVVGDLELRGVTAPLTFAANIRQSGDGEIIADAHFDFDRTRWGIIYGSSRFFRHLGMHVVYDLISVQLKLNLVTAKSD